MVASISFVIPTPGRPELEVCLLSLAPQIGPGDECIVVGDTCEGSLPQTEKLVKSFGEQFKYVEHNSGEHDYGHSQINYGLTLAHGTHVGFNDDDDVWVPGAIPVIHQAIGENPDQPLLFRFISYTGFPCWVKKGFFQPMYVGGHCLVCPNRNLGKWASVYEGDWYFIDETIRQQGGEDRIVWRDEVIALARPSAEVINEIRRIAGVAV